MNLRSLCPDFLFPFLQRAAALPDNLLLAYYRLTNKADPKGVLMISASRNDISGNFAFIAEQLKNTEFKVTHLFEGDCSNRRKRLKAIALNQNILLDDYTKFIYPLVFPKSTKLVQVWHSTGAFKRMGFARMGRRGSTVKTSLTHRNYTHVIVSSKGVVQNFCQAFGVAEDKVYPIGVPRTDLFFNETEILRIRNGFYGRYPHLKDKKLILFAPTFRGDTKDKAYYPDSWFNPAEFIKSLPEDYVLGIKLHPFIKKRMAVPKEYSDRVFDFSAEREINPLLFVTDTLIADYSSVIFEYAFLNKPIIFYLPDLAEYDRDRSFFYDFSEYLYGTRCDKKEELPTAVLKPCQISLKKEQFFKKFLSSCDGHSTERFINEILRK